MTVKVRCDDKAIIYIDGIYHGITRGYNEIWVNDGISESAQLIAVDCENTGNNTSAGLIASFSTGLTTDNTWRCSGDNYAGWEGVAFDDQSWSNAYVAQNNREPAVGKWKEDTAFPADAKWIWKHVYESYHADAGHSYCRGRLRECGHTVVTILF